jgi:hypothetical protein
MRIAVRQTTPNNELAIGTIPGGCERFFRLETLMNVTANVGRDKAVHDA